VTVNDGVVPVHVAVAVKVHVAVAVAVKVHVHVHDTDHGLFEFCVSTPFSCSRRVRRSGS
jgi:hypothetical protein